MKKIYFHSGQINFAQSRKKVKVAVNGRAWGKSTYIALQVYLWLKEMAKARIFLSSTTLDQIMNLTLPEIKSKWEQMGLHENLHFVVGKVPPAHFQEPYKKPNKYDNVITFWNGFTVILLSTLQINSKRGGSYDMGIIDEASFVKPAAYKSVLKQSIRGNVGRFPTDIHHTIVLLTSRPRTEQGKWIYFLKELHERNPDQVTWIEESAVANMAVLGKAWFKEQRDTLEEIEYMIEILNKDLDLFPQGTYYNSFDRKRNTYKPSYDQLGTALDIKERELIELSWDFSGRFTGCTVWQQQANVERCMRRYFVTKKGTYRNVVEAFIKDFEHHKFKYIRLYGDPNGWNANPYDDLPLYKGIEQLLSRAGWTVEHRAHRNYIKLAHQPRCEFMRKVMEHTETYLPKIEINIDACMEVIRSIENTDVRPDYTKDKSNEKDKNYPQELAPHFSDTVDYYIYVKHGNKLQNTANHRAGEVWLH